MLRLSQSSLSVSSFVYASYFGSSEVNPSQACPECTRHDNDAAYDCHHDSLWKTFCLSHDVAGLDIQQEVSAVRTMDLFE